MALLNIEHAKGRVELPLNFGRLCECHSSELRNTGTQFVKCKFSRVGVYCLPKSVPCFHILQCQFILNRS
jgi:hypothetical protein